MEAALAELASIGHGNITAMAKKHGVNRSTLSKRFSGRTGTLADGIESHQFLNNIQEERLIKWIGAQCDLCLPPTTRLVNAMAAELAGRPPARAWASRFVSRRKLDLDNRFLNTLDLARHQADSRASYKQYFATIKSKIAEYEVEAENIYNMDEKGFMLGQMQKHRRIFTRASNEGTRIAMAGQDGSREWISTIATICADGSHLSPALIYKAASGDIQDSWLDGFDPDQHSCLFGASPNGWTSDELCLAWLEQIFEKETTAKARRRWRLLFVDGHGSHLNLKFVNRCLELKILLACYPPHSTHRLQPLDIGCFAALAQQYSRGLDEHVRRCFGFTSMKKRDFFTLFWTAFSETFRPEVINSAWQKAGIQPFNPDAVLDGLPESPQVSQDPEKLLLSSPVSAFDTPSTRHKVRHSVNRAVACNSPRTQKALKKLGRAYYRCSGDLKMARLENQQLRQSLALERRHKKRQKRLFEQLRADNHSATLFLSPSKVQLARGIAASREQEREQSQQDRQDRAAARVVAKALKEAQAQEKREARAIARAERQAAEAVRKAALKEAQEAKKAQRELEKLNKPAPRPRGRPRKQPKVVMQQTVEVVQSKPQRGVEPLRTTKGRVVKPTARARASDRRSR